MDITLRSLMTTAVDRFGDQIAIISATDTLSYGQLIERANQLAHRLIQMGVRSGQPVALMMKNSAEWAIADQAIIRAGGAKVPINDMLTAAEIDYIFRDSGARVAIIDDHFVSIAEAADLDHVVNLSAAPSGGRPSNPCGLPEVTVAADDTALILYTGGTTGQQKGVVHSHRSLAANLLAHQIEIGLLDDEQMLLTAPLAHSAGFLLQAGLCRGATITIEQKFDVDEVLRQIDDGSVTFLFMVPTMIYRLLDAAEKDGKQRQQSSLRTILYGAAPITAERLRRGLDMFGPVFMQLYGQSEAPNFLTRLTRQDHQSADPRRLTSCGRPAAMVRIAVLDPNGNQVATGQIGEICAQAPYLMDGYLGLDTKTRETLQHGWLHTGDIGSVDADGYVYLLDRKNDMVISGGMNVYTSEVEQVISACPGVSAVAVVGVPHPDWGEAVVAFIDPSSHYDERLVREACRERLATYKRPKAVATQSPLPTTAVGKIDKKALRTQPIE
ncbi:AMP-dependent synthetase [Williamsia muralis]|uniref:AMP-dependent synthetase n=2 Tax=Williamsia marianensis TaxID=85044 RepID=A0A2G3PVK5_WILMA|nr:AMP-dependent synthetase [Williamsia marianensis]